MTNKEYNKRMMQAYLWSSFFIFSGMFFVTTTIVMVSKFTH